MSIRTQLTAPLYLPKRGDFSIFEDFYTGFSATRWILTSATQGTGVGGQIDMTTAGTGDAFDMVNMAGDHFLIQADGEIRMDARLLGLVEGATNAMSVAVGFASDPVGASPIVNGGGIRTTGTVHCLHKRTATLNTWELVSSHDGVQTITAVQGTTGGAKTISICLRSLGRTEFEVVPWLDQNGGTDLKQGLTAVNRWAKHRLLLGTQEAITPFVQIKNIAAAEVGFLDYIGAAQTRHASNNTP